MATAHVVKLKDDRYGDVNLDINNGYVYDQAGNQIDRWAPTDQSYSRMLADYAAEDMLGRVTDAMSSAVHVCRPDEARARTERAAESAKLARMKGWGGDRLVAMAGELGTADVHLPAAMSNYAAGYQNDKPMADMYAPPILDSKPSNKYFTFAKEDAFQRAQPSIGGTAAQVAEIAPRLSNATFTTIEYALGGFVGVQIDAAADAPLRIRQATTKRVLDALILEREIRVANLATTSGTWDSTVVTSLGATAKWNGGSTSDPVADIQNKIETSWGTPNGILMSRQVFHAFQRNSQVQKYFTYKDSSKPLPDATQMSALLELPPIYVADMRYIAASGALTYVWGTSAILFRVPPQMPPTSQDDISSAATFRWNADGIKDGQASGGMVVREYFVQDRGSGGGNKVVVVHHDTEVQTSKFLGGLISGAFQ